jgi:N-acetylglutamate synthase-like GNAT family acetyltransferase
MTDVITPTRVPAQHASEPRPVYRRLRPDDLPHVLSLLRRCSTRTLYRRFHGVTDGSAWAAELVRKPDDETVAAWMGSSCIGLATLTTGDPRPDLGVLVEDAWQRRGVGTALVSLVVANAHASGVRELSADILAESDWALSSLARMGRMEVNLSFGVYSVRVTLSSS